MINVMMDIDFTLDKMIQNDNRRYSKEYYVLSIISNNYFLEDMLTGIYCPSVVQDNIHIPIYQNFKK